MASSHPTPRPSTTGVAPAGRLAIPAANQPGTLREQLRVAKAYLTTPPELTHAERYQLARRMAMHHARRTP